MKYRQRLRRLALSYLAVIMTLSVAFSGIIYTITAAQLSRPLPINEHNQASLVLIEDQFNRRLEQRDNQTRGSVIMSLIILNAIMLFAGYWLSLWLARRTLAPIERSITQQAQFISDASHELRTPLSALLLSNEVALRKSTLTDQKARQVLQQNVVEIKKLTDLSNSLLDLAKMENTTFKAEKINPSLLIEEIVTKFTPVATAKHLKLIHNQKAVIGEVKIQASVVRQILAILVDNAIKYAPPTTGKVTLQAQLKKNTLELTVKDNGPGIAPSDRKRIFDRFYRADSARTRTDISGYGLGLSIAKSLADQCGYIIRVKSRPSIKGSEFKLIIPLSNDK